MDSTFQYHNILMVLVFVIGYFCITIEHIIRIDKATIALLMGVICWVIQFANEAPKCNNNSLTCLGEHLSNISQVVFFLLGALAIVEIINVHKGFAVISDVLRTQSKRKMLWAFGIFSFLLSAVLDNLTTTIVMVTLLHKLIDKGYDRMVIGSGVVIAANAGGAWTPIGDVTTTMLWIGGQVSTIAIMKDLFIPSIVSLLVSLFCLSFMLKGDFEPKELHFSDKKLEPHGELVFFLGIGALIFVPIFKVVTGLPPFMGVLLGLSVLWLVTDVLHHMDNRQYLRMPSVFTRIDLSGLLFFLGILLAIDALDSAGILNSLARWFDKYVDNVVVIASMIGLVSAIVDNVPLVAASMGMYSLEQYPVDHTFWQLIAFCAGTGGSILIIGSAAGVVFMTLEKVTFTWYLKNISLAAIIGYFVGILSYVVW